MILNVNLRTWKSCMVLHTDILYHDAFIGKDIQSSSHCGHMFKVKLVHSKIMKLHLVNVTFFIFLGFSLLVFQNVHGTYYIL